MIKFRGSMKDGRSIVLRYEYKGDIVPGFDEHQNRFEAFTSWYQIKEDSPEAAKEWKSYFESARKPTGVHKAPWNVEDYVQVSRRDIEEGRVQAEAFMLDATRQRLEKAGVELASLVSVTDAETDLRALSKGDVVILKSGSPRMTIVETDSVEIGKARVAWFDGASRCSDEFPLEALHLVLWP